jgi:polyhydroxybutyrate depolymerase
MREPTRRWRAALLLFVVYSFLLVACGHLGKQGSSGSTSASQAEQVELSFGGLSRTALVHLPSVDSEAPMPVVLVFHGGGGTAESMERISSFDSVADRGQFIAVYPEAYRRSWADGRGTASADKAQVDDVGFINALLDKLEQQYNVDQRQIFATGLSNGAFFSQRLGCELSDRIAAIAPVAGTLEASFASSCQPAYPVSVLEIHGTVDPLVPYKGGVMRGLGGRSTILSAEDAVGKWAAIAGCSPSPTTATMPDQVDDGTHLATQVFSGCTSGVAIELYEVEGGGHTWPGGKQYLPVFLIGKTTHQFYASNTIWEFFAAHPATW